MLEDLSPQFQRHASAWLRENLPEAWRWDHPGLHRSEEHYVSVRKEWAARLNAGGLAGVSWPREYGGAGLGLAEELVLAEEFARACAPEPIHKNALNYIGRLLLVFGSEELKRRFLPRMRTGQDLWCQAFSEPDAGSDLASLRTRAERKGDQWVITGQKIWVSLAPIAAYGMVLTRTDPAARPHRGLTMFVVPMDSPGVTCRPIRQITGFCTDFAEIFYDGVSVPDTLRVGEINGGWEAAMGCLAFERGLNYVYRALKLNEEVKLLRQSGCEDPSLPALADEVIGVGAFVRKFARRWVGGMDPGSTSSLLKLLWSETHQKVLAARLAQAHAEPACEEVWNAAMVDWLTGQAETIYAGTSEIQRNVIAERLLGLPKSV